MLSKIEKAIKRFEKDLKTKLQAKNHFTSLLSRFEGRRDLLELFFYADNITDAQNLRLELNDNLDSVEVSNSHKKWLIFGQIDMNPESSDFDSFVEKMTVIAFEQNCVFDGWGIGIHLDK